MLFSDESTYQNFGFRHNPEEETAADAKAIELLKNSPYRRSWALRALPKAVAGPLAALSALSDRASGKQLRRQEGPNHSSLAALMTSAPELDENKLDQIAAFRWAAESNLIPGRTGRDGQGGARCDHSVRDKMPFELTPFFPRLSRLGADTVVTQNTGGKN